MGRHLPSHHFFSKEKFLNFEAFGTIQWGWPFLSSLISIILIDLLLAGDNAVVIAMAVRTLPKSQRGKGIIYGSLAAVLLRVLLTFFVAQMLALNYVKLIGGLVIVWIAVKLFVEDEEAVGIHKEAATLWHAVRLIVVADISMALDNMLAVGAVSNGNFFLLLFGLGLSIPFIVFTSSLISRLMDNYPFIIYIGAALLGKIGGQMIITDPVVSRFITPTPLITHSVEVACAAAVILIGRFRVRRDAAKQAGDARGTAKLFP
jgi:YjbE family integral membrane protein